MKVKKSVRTDIGGPMLFAVKTGGVPELSQHKDAAAWIRAARRVIRAGGQAFSLQMYFEDNRIHIDYDTASNAVIVDALKSRKRG